MRGQGRQVEPEDRREHGTVALDGRDTEALGRQQPAEKIGHLGKGWARHRVTNGVAPRAVHQPLKLIQLARERTTRQRSLGGY